MTEISEVAERVAARRAELDEEEQLLVERLEEVRAEREDLAAAIRVWERAHAQLETEKITAQAVPARVGGRGVLLVPHREVGGVPPSGVAIRTAPVQMACDRPARPRLPTAARASQGSAGRPAPGCPARPGLDLRSREGCRAAEGDLTPRLSQNRA
ncbi:hypothetical protein [Streptomyces antibioticus]|uniref:hypothetical protein n=1 Tax=Streptomyces antibioticus TaxID=1890 RepID=UPI0033B0A369